MIGVSMFSYRKADGRWWLWLVLSVVVLILDQLSKSFVVASLTYGQPYPVFPFLNFTLVYNHGAAFSFLSDAGGWQVWFLLFVALSITSGLVFWLYRTPRRLWAQSLALGLIIGGALGNIIDRVRLHKVVDFIDFHINSWHFAIFNVADMAVSIGVVVLLLSFLFEEKEAV
jgi:signal peptidase II